MKSRRKTYEQLQQDNKDLLARLEEAEETLRAIGSGEVDAFVVSGAEGEQVFTLKGAEHPYRVLVETMNEGAATLDADGTILYCNSRLAALLQLPLERIIGTKFDCYVAAIDKSLIAARLTDPALKHEKDEIRLIPERGGSVPVLLSCSALDILDKRGVSMVVTDLTEQKRSEEFMASERLARSILEQAGEAIVVCNDLGIIIRASQIAHDLCGGNPMLKRFDEILKLQLQETGNPFSVASLLHGRRYHNVEVIFNRPHNSMRYLLLNATPLTNDMDHIIGCIVSLIDITARKQVAEALQQSESMFRALFENSLDAVFLTKADGGVLAANPAACAMFGRSEEEIIQVGRKGLVVPDDPKHLAALEERSKTGKIEAIELEYVRKNGQRFFGEVDSVMLPGEPQRSFVIVRDITERKQAEKDIKDSLAEKEVMLREIHHRVKNNLQVISSLVSLQADSLRDERICNELKDVRNRVRSMALIHEKLYQTNELAQLNFADYTASLLSYLWRSQGSLAAKVRLQLDMAPVKLSIEAAVPCGLILNELVGNALKHAFPDNEGGKVEVRLEYEETPGNVSLRVCDNGVGLPSGLDWRQAHSLGLRLTQILVKQLRGTVEAIDGPGTEFRIIFPLATDRCQESVASQ